MEPQGGKRGRSSPGFTSCFTTASARHSTVFPSLHSVWFSLRFSVIGLQVGSTQAAVFEADSPSESGPWAVNSHEQAALSWVTCTLRVTLASSGTPEGCRFLGGCTSQLRLSKKVLLTGRFKQQKFIFSPPWRPGVWDQDADTPVSSGASLPGL